jgi:predicted adenylyl cyclase CyaB
MINIEIKARCTIPQQAAIQVYLEKAEARYVGLDEQTDTYFAVRNGRLKVREGKIETALIFYQRPNQSGPKQSDYKLVRNYGGQDTVSKVKECLIAAQGVLVIVKKARRIYYLNNVKFHLDDVDGLGRFVEIEACEQGGSITYDQGELLEQCEKYMRAFNIQQDDLVTHSYSDLLLGKQDVNDYLRQAVDILGSR